MRKPFILSRNSRVIVVYPMRTIHNNMKAAARLEALCAALDVYARVERLGRDEMSKEFVDAADLVISVGGDGTALAVAHYLEKTPLLSLRLKDSSVGYLCAADVAQASNVVAKLFDGEAYGVMRQRMALEINGEVVGKSAYNDILVAHACPARASRYVLCRNDLRETHCSSGIWFATASGSHAAARAAGATPLSVDDARFLFRIRELGYADVADPTIGMTFDVEHAPTFLTLDNHLMAFGDGDLWHIPIPQNAVFRVVLAAPLFLITL